MNLLLNILKTIFIKKYRRYAISLYKALFYATYKKDYPRAIQEYNSILDKGVYFSEANIQKNLGMAYLWNDDFDEAEKTFRKALELTIKKKGHDPELYRYMGDICFKKGLFKNSLMFYEKAIQFGSKGFINKMLVNMDYVLKQKASLEEYKDLFPFMTAYFEQNKR